MTRAWRGLSRFSIPLVLVALAATAALGGAAAQAALQTADAVVIRSVQLSPSKILANGGQSTVTVTVSGPIEREASITLSTTLGAFGSPSGPSRIVLAVAPTPASEAVATAVLFGDGRRGIAAVTARVGESVRSAAVILAGATTVIAFESPGAGAVLAAASAPLVRVQLRDAGGVTVPDVAVRLSTTAGTLRSDGAGEGRQLDLRTDNNGRVAATVVAPPGAVTLRASAGEVSAERSFTLHGPAASLQLLALRARVNLGDDPFPAPDGTLVAIALDDGGRPVPGMRIRFTSDSAGVSVVQSGAGESDVTDSGGRASGHVSAAGAAAPGSVVIGASVDGLEASVALWVVGPPAEIALRAVPVEAGLYRLHATVADATGTGVPTGYHLAFTAEGGAGVDPDEALVREGEAAVDLHVTGPVSEVIVGAVLIDAPAPLSVRASLAEVLSGGVVLEPGLNAVTWSGPVLSIAVLVEPIADVVLSVWRFDEALGWQGYFPTIGLGVEFSLSPGERFYLFVQAAAVLPLP